MRMRNGGNGTLGGLANLVVALERKTATAPVMSPPPCAVGRNATGPPKILHHVPIHVVSYQSMITSAV